MKTPFNPDATLRLARPPFPVSSHTSKSVVLLGIGMLLAGAAPLSGQGAGEGSSSPLVEHAQIGKLEAIGLHTNRIILARPRLGPNPATYQSYDTNAQTQVGGLGSVMRVSKIPPEAIGEVVVMWYVSPGKHFLARRIYFTGAREIRETGGTIMSLSASERTMTLRTEQGRERRIRLGSGPGTAIDSDRGLLQFSDLQVGQEITVYFAHQPGPGDLPGRAFLVRIQ